MKRKTFLGTWPMIFCVGMCLATPVAIPAATFCVNNAAELQAALTVAAGNGADDVIKLIQGSYIGNFIYGTTEPFNLFVEGGYTYSCASREISGANTIIDGNSAAEALVLVNAAPVTFGVDGITVQKGKNKAGLYIKTPGGTATVTNCIAQNNASGGASVEAGMVTLTGNTFTANVSPLSGVGAVVKGKTVILTGNIFSENKGTTSSSNGGGVVVSMSAADSTLTLSDNTFSNNFSYRGGGAYITGTNSTVRISRNIFIGNNSYYYGGGAYVTGSNSSATLTGNIFISNTVTSSGSGGGAYVSGSVFDTLSSNLFVNNSSTGNGGGIYISTSSLSSAKVYVVNNTITGNYAGLNGGGMYLSVYSDTGKADVYNNIVWDNEAPTGSDIYINNDGNGNYLPSAIGLYANDFNKSASGVGIKVPFVIDASNLNNVDPLFVDVTNGNYHLQYSSSCIDAGVYDAPLLPETDMDGQPRIISGKVDIGADEFADSSQFLGVWPDGIWYWIQSTKQWTKIPSTSNAFMVAAGKVDADSVDDIIGVWPSGLWVRYSATGQWVKLSTSLPSWITAGDMNNDGRDDVIGSWDNNGVYYRDSATGSWVKITTPAGQLAVGYIGGNGRNDLLGVWDSGLWVRYSLTAAWQKIDPTIPVWIAAGDMTGDGRADCIGSYASGTWYRNSATAAWTKISTPAEQLTTGDINGDGRDDLIGVWSNGVWVRNGVTGQWQQVTSSSPKWIATGRVVGPLQAVGSLDDPVLKSAERKDTVDLSQEGPGGMAVDIDFLDTE